MAPPVSSANVGAKGLRMTSLFDQTGRHKPPTNENQHRARLPVVAVKAWTVSRNLIVESVLTEVRS